MVNKDALHRLAAILKADVAGYSRLMAQDEDAAEAYALLGKPAEAISRLRAASVDGLPHYPLFRDDPQLASLQAEPEMNQLLKDLQTEWTGYRNEFGRS